MSDTQLLAQFNQLLDESPNFKNMSPQDQMEIREGFAIASDQALKEAIDLLIVDNREANEEIQEANEKIKEEKRIQREKLLKERLMKLKAEEAKAKVADSKEEENLLSELDKI